jgi:phosphatidylethanolamine-binding protein
MRIGMETPVFSATGGLNDTDAMVMHRYIFLLFNQPEDFDSQTAVTPDTPINLFNLSSFAEAVGLGDPLGGTFMLVAPDPTA